MQRKIQRVGKLLVEEINGTEAHLCRGGRPGSSTAVAQYASLARSNSMLQRERMMLQRAIDSQRREREARLITGDAVAAMIAHEVNQPFAAVVNNASACLHWLAAQNLEEVRQSAARVIADGHRASEIIGVTNAIEAMSWVGSEGAA
jgi:signal transduction histidine kinase